MRDTDVEADGDFSVTVAAGGSTVNVGAGGFVAVTGGGASPISTGAGPSNSGPAAVASISCQMVKPAAIAPAQSSAIAASWIFRIEGQATRLDQ